MDDAAGDPRAALPTAEPMRVSWHAMPLAEAFGRLDSRPEGLTADEARERLDRFGRNRLRPPPRRHPLRRLLAQFHNVLIYVLIGAALVTALLAHWVDTGVIVGVVLINAAIGFVQEGKAESALAAIRTMLSPQASVLRDGRRIVVPADVLVPGDIVFLQSGDKAPADLRLIRVKGLRLQEAALTGESLAVEKGVAPVPPAAPLGDRSSMAFAGTLVAAGQGTGIVAATGAATEIGRIGSMLVEVQTVVTPLLRHLATFGRWLTAAIVLAAAATFAFGVFVHGEPAGDMFMAAVGLAVAAIPEGLPAIMTITLALGVERMARRNAIVRRLPAVETLGSVTVACSDKTGTLTRNEMTVQTVATGRHLFEVTGAGYAPDGAFLLDGAEESIGDHPILRELARAALLCSDATLREADGDWIVHGDPTEGALLTVAMKAGLDPDFESKACPRTDVVPFESQHRFMATLHHDHEGHGFIYVKGAPERILEMCARQRGPAADEPLDADYWRRRMDDMASRGQRVLALAWKAVAAERADLLFADVEDGLTLIGLFGLADPPRVEAIAAVARCQAAGIRVKMVTGDHAGTARAVARRLGLLNADVVLTGSELDTLDDDRLAIVAREVDVFARTSPAHKLRLVRALQSAGEVVAMTGDGVNDAPALKQADVGVAMGLKGTEAAKEAAVMVLADDNFATIAHAVEEGRTIYDNLKKAIAYILPTSGGEAVVIVMAILLGLVLPITPVQILWVNMVTAVTLGLALAFEPPESDVMRRPPRRPDEPILSRLLLWRVAFVSAILVAGTFGLFLWAREHGADVATARTVAVNTLVMFEVFYLFNARYVLAPVLNRRGLFGSRAVLIAIGLVVVLQVLMTYAPPMQHLFGTRPLDAGTWIEIVAVASTVLFLVEIEKWALRAWLGKRRAA